MTNYQVRRSICQILIYTFLACLLQLAGFHTTQASIETPQLVIDENYGLSTGHVYPQDDQVWVNVIVELTMPSVTEFYTDYTAQVQTQAQVQAAKVDAATRIHLTAVENAQDAVLAQLSALGAETIYRVQRVYNGIAIQIPKDRLAEIYSLPDVKKVHPLISKWPYHQISVPFIGTQALWDNKDLVNLGVAGEGITIAVIDTGVDYLHPTFGGPATGYGTNDKTRIGDVPGFPNTKIIGGHDFVGENYNSNPDDLTYQPEPQPDPDPMDCYDHGTHVTGTVAGYGVTENRTMYEGSYKNASDLQSFFIGPGVAPLAEVYSLKVFGCDGSSDVTDLAIEWAVDPNGDGSFSDRVDVINMSLGSTYGSHEDMTAIASNNATKVGVIVVASAGNSGDTHYATGTPAAAEHAISVAAIVHRNLPDTLAPFSSRGPRRADTVLKPDIAAPGAMILSASMGRSDRGPVRSRRISGTSMASPHVAGAMALLRQVYPDWSVDDLKTLVMNTAMPWIRTERDISSLTYSPVRIGSGRIDLTKAIQNKVLAYNADDPGLVSVSFATPQVLLDTIAVKNIRLANKSDEPATYILTYVSHTDTPGVEFILPEERTFEIPGNNFLNFPLMMQVKSNAIKHVSDETMTQTQEGVARHWISEEAGYLLFWPEDSRFQTTLTDELVDNVSSKASGAANFEYDPLTKVLNFTLTINKADEIGVTSVQLRRGLPGTQGVTAHTLYSSISSQVSLDVPYSGSVVLDPNDERLLLNGGFYVNVSSFNNIEGELRGQLDSVVPILNLPVYAAPRVAAKMTATPYQLAPDKTDEVEYELALTGIDLVGDDPPEDVVSLVTAMELQYKSSNTLPVELNEDLVDPDKLFTEFDHADLKYIGIASNFGASSEENISVQNTTLYFGIVAYEEHTVPNEVKFSIYFDIDRDGDYEYRLYNTDEANYKNRYNVSDTFITALETLPSPPVGQPEVKSRQKKVNIFGPERMDTAIYHTDMMILPINASELDLDDNSSGFNYYVESESSDEEASIIDRTPVLYYDAGRPGLTFYQGIEGTPLYQDLNGEKIALKFDRMNYAINGSEGLLLLHHHNLSGERDQVIPIEYDLPPQFISAGDDGLSNIYLPIVVNK